LVLVLIGGRLAFSRLTLPGGISSVRETAQIEAEEAALALEAASCWQRAGTRA
jgi:hypothetical protein